nr:hypothetical protein [Gemmatimonadaceae bacterium]
MRLVPSRARRRLAALALLLATTPLGAQERYPTQWDPALLRRPDVRAALTALERGFPAQVDEWVRIAELPGTSRSEAERAAYVRRAMEAQGLQVSTDSIGNVTGVRKGTGGGPTIVFAAHLDIVHPLGTNLRVTRQGDTLRGPGVFDNSAS